MFLQKAFASGGSNLARLGELGGKLLPYFPINRGRSEGERGSTLLVLHNHLKLVRKIVSVKKIQAEALPKRFRNIFVGDFTKIFNRSSSFVVRSSVFNR
ncbi:hypothetical protein GmHk_20G057078 [Glycine max]|nr:hypothetical protein GmHk_20G057078 [Glycine max]